MNRRDHFAGLALQTLLENFLQSYPKSMVTSTNLENLTVKAWEIADEMEKYDTPKNNET